MLVVRLIFRRLLMVQLLVSSIAVLGNTIDSVIVARMLGTNAIAACGLLNPFAILTAAISGIIVSGTQMVCSKSVGAGKTDNASRQLGIAFAASIAISATIVVLGYLFMDQFCLILGANPETQLFFDTKAYACGLLASFVPAIPSALIMFTCVSNGDLMRCRIGGAAIVTLNIVFSIASIVVFNGGLFGVGLATTLSAYLVFFYLLGHFRKKDLSLRPSFTGLAWNDFKQIILIGSPRAAYKVCTFLLILLFNNMLLDFYSQDHVAAYSVVRNIYGIVSFSTAALIYCTSLTTSTFFGEENRHALRDTVREFTRLSVVIGVTGFVLICLFGRALTLLFLDPGTAIYETACLGLVIISASLPFCALAASLQTFFIGTGHQNWGTVLNVVSVLVLIPATGFLLMPVSGALFVYGAFPAGYLLELVAIGLFVLLVKRQNPLRADSYLFVPKDFGVPKEHELSFEVRTPDDLAKSQAQFERFCQSVGFGNVASQGFQALSVFANSRMRNKKDRKGEACFVRAYLKEGELSLIVWNTFGLTGSDVSRILNRGRELLRIGKTSEAKPKSNSNERAQATRKPERQSDDQAAQLDTDLAEALHGCEYSLGNPFGLERLLITFEAPKGQVAQSDEGNRPTKNAADANQEGRSPLSTNSPATVTA